MSSGNCKTFLSATSGKGRYFTEANFEELTFQNDALNKKMIAWFYFGSMDNKSQ